MPYLGASEKESSRESPFTLGGIDCQTRGPTFEQLWCKGFVELSFGPRTLAAGLCACSLRPCARDCVASWHLLIGSDAHRR
jgi:hypothetical protein